MTPRKVRTPQLLHYTTSAAHQATRSGNRKSLNQDTRYLQEPVGSAVNCQVQHTAEAAGFLCCRHNYFSTYSNSEVPHAWLEQGWNRTGNPTVSQSGGTAGARRKVSCKRTSTAQRKRLWSREDRQCVPSSHATAAEGIVRKSLPQNLETARQSHCCCGGALVSSRPFLATFGMRKHNCSPQQCLPLGERHGFAIGERQLGDFTVPGITLNRPGTTSIPSRLNSPARRTAT